MDFTATELENECWKDIQGYEGIYQASSLGRVKAFEKLQRGVSRTGNVYYTLRPERILALNDSGKGYSKVTLFSHLKAKQRNVHALIGETFISNPGNKREVNHIDGNKKNNRVSNLEWATSSENKYHAYATGLRLGKKGEGATNVKLNKGQVLQIRKMYKETKVTQLAIAKSYNVTEGCVSGILRNLTWRHI